MPASSSVVTGVTRYINSLQENNLCGYYNFDSNPGIKAKGVSLVNGFVYLDDEAVVTSLRAYRS